MPKQKLPKKQSFKDNSDSDKTQRVDNRTSKDNKQGLSSFDPENALAQNEVGKKIETKEKITKEISNSQEQIPFNKATYKSTGTEKEDSSDIKFSKEKLPNFNHDDFLEEVAKILKRFPENKRQSHIESITMAMAIIKREDPNRGNQIVEEKDLLKPKSQNLGMVGRLKNFINGQLENIQKQNEREPNAFNIKQESQKQNNLEAVDQEKSKIVIITKPESQKQNNLEAEEKEKAEIAIPVIPDHVISKEEEVKNIQNDIKQKLQALIDDPKLTTDKYLRGSSKGKLYNIYETLNLEMGKIYKAQDFVPTTQTNIGVANLLEQKLDMILTKVEKLTRDNNLLKERVDLEVKMNGLSREKLEDFMSLSHKIKNLRRMAEIGKDVTKDAARFASIGLGIAVAIPVGITMGTVVMATAVGIGAPVFGTYYAGKTAIKAGNAGVKAVREIAERNKNKLGKKFRELSRSFMQNDREIIRATSNASFDHIIKIEKMLPVIERLSRDLSEPIDLSKIKDNEFTKALVDKLKSEYNLIDNASDISNESKANAKKVKRKEILTNFIAEFNQSVIDQVAFDAVNGLRGDHKTKLLGKSLFSFINDSNSNKKIDINNSQDSLIKYIDEIKKTSPYKKSKHLMKVLYIMKASVNYEKQKESKTLNDGIKKINQEIETAYQAIDNDKAISNKADAKKDKRKEILEKYKGEPIKTSKKNDFSESILSQQNKRNALIRNQLVKIANKDIINEEIKTAYKAIDNDKTILNKAAAKKDKKIEILKFYKTATTLNSNSISVDSKSKEKSLSVNIRTYLTIRKAINMLATRAMERKKNQELHTEPNMEKVIESANNDRVGNALQELSNIAYEKASKHKFLQKDQSSFSGLTLGGDISKKISDYDALQSNSSTYSLSDSESSLSSTGSSNSQISFNAKGKMNDNSQVTRANTTDNVPIGSELKIPREIELDIVSPDKSQNNKDLKNKTQLYYNKDATKSVGSVGKRNDRSRLLTQQLTKAYQSIRNNGKQKNREVG